MNPPEEFPEFGETKPEQKVGNFSADDYMEASNPNRETVANNASETPDGLDEDLNLEDATPDDDFADMLGEIQEIAADNDDSFQLTAVEQSIEEKPKRKKLTEAERIEQRRLELEKREKIIQALVKKRSYKFYQQPEQVAKLTQVLSDPEVKEDHKTTLAEAYKKLCESEYELKIEDINEEFLGEGGNGAVFSMSNVPTYYTIVEHMLWLETSDFKGDKDATRLRALKNLRQKGETMNVAAKIFKAKNINEKRLAAINNEAAYGTGAETPDNNQRYGVQYYKDLEVAIMTMEEEEGRDLSQVKHNEFFGKNNIESFFQIFAGGMLGLHRQSQAGKSHGDVKLGNIILLNSGRVKWVDFATAQLGNSIRKGGKLQGTPAYLPPERFNDQEILQDRLDTFAYGVAMWKLLTGEHLFSGSDDVDVLRADRMAYYRGDTKPDFTYKHWDKVPKKYHARLKKSIELIKKMVSAKSIERGGVLANTKDSYNISNFKDKKSFDQIEDFNNADSPVTKVALGSSKVKKYFGYLMGLRDYNGTKDAPSTEPYRKIGARQNLVRKGVTFLLGAAAVFDAWYITSGKDQAIEKIDKDQQKIAQADAENFKKMEIIRQAA